VDRPSHPRGTTRQAPGRLNGGQDRRAATAGSWTVLWQSIASAPIRLVVIVLLLVVAVVVVERSSNCPGRAANNHKCWKRHDSLMTPSHIHMLAHAHRYTVDIQCAGYDSRGRTVLYEQIGQYICYANVDEAAPVWRPGVRIPARSRDLVQAGSGAHPDSTGFLSRR